MNKYVMTNVINIKAIPTPTVIPISWAVEYPAHIAAKEYIK